jgi:hypothetical protein
MSLDLASYSQPTVYIHTDMHKCMPTCSTRIHTVGHAHMQYYIHTYNSVCTREIVYAQIQQYMHTCSSMRTHAVVHARKH